MEITVNFPKHTTPPSSTPSMQKQDLVPHTISEIVEKHLRSISERQTELSAANYTPIQLSNLVLKGINVDISLLNTTLKGHTKLREFKILPPPFLARILILFHDVVRVVQDGVPENPDEPLLGIYVNSGPEEGIYSFAKMDIKKVAARYNPMITKKEFEEVFEVLLREAPRKLENFNPNLIPLNNGIFDYTTKKLLPFHRDIVFRNKYATNFNPQATLSKFPTKDGDWDVETWIRSLSQDPGVPELHKRRNVKAKYLSGGERQMLKISRALSLDPKFLMVDELSLGLASPVVTKLMSVIENIAGDGVGVLLVEQFRHVYESTVSREYTLDKGRII